MNTLRAALECYNTERGGLPYYPRKPWEDYAHLFNTPPEIKKHDNLYMRHKKREIQDQWKKFWRSVGYTIKRSTERGWPEREIWAELASMNFSDYVALRKDFEYVTKG
jgi:hypothetical protein